jgi:hypothetical protein
MNTHFFNETHHPIRQNEDDPIEDEHAWDVYLGNGSITSHFPIEFDGGATVQYPRFVCCYYRSPLVDVRGKVRKTAAAAMIEAAGMCERCNEVTGFDTRIRASGVLDPMYTIGEEVFLPTIKP